MAHLCAGSSAAEEGPILMLGVGNRFRRDDGFAYHVAAELWRALGVERTLEELEELQVHGQLRTLCLPQLVPELAELLAQQAVVVLVDAAVGGPAGLTLCQVQPASGPGLWWSHSGGLARLASLAKHLYGQVPRLFVLSAAGEDFSFGEGLSAGVAGLVKPAVQELLQLLPRR
jgi:hydrogenase maturation protease